MCFLALFASGSRDGNIMVWDKRISPKGNNDDDVDDNNNNCHNNNNSTHLTFIVSINYLGLCVFHKSFPPYFLFLLQD